MATVIITGGTGLVGDALSPMLVSKGHEVIILTREARPAKPGIRFAKWDVKNGTIDESIFADAEYVVHLAGANVADQRWTDARKKEILESRVKSGELLVKTLKKVPHKVHTFVSASAIGWYGADPSIPNPMPFTEEMPYDKSFLGETCYQWEKSLDPLLESRIRLVKLRTGIVLSNEGGAFAEFKKPVRFGIAGILGSGKQIISWIHIEDLCRQYLFAMENIAVSGVYNAVAPEPVSNRELCLKLARTMKGSFNIPINVPEFVLKMMLGEMSIEVLKSATVSTAKMQRKGFTFLYPSIDSALAELLR